MVFTGDAGLSDNLYRMAKGADVLVADAEAVERLASKAGVKPAAARLLGGSRTTAESFQELLDSRHSALWRKAQGAITARPAAIILASALHTGCPHPLALTPSGSPGSVMMS